MIVTPVPVPAAGQPLPDPTDLSTWAVRMGEMHRWERLDAAPGINALATASYENALDAEASAEAAAASVGAAMWAADTNYATGAAARSPINYRVYIRKSPGGVNATDPSLSALWEPSIVTRVTSGVLEHWDGTQWIPQGWKELATFATASGTAVTFSGIPSWVRELRLLFNGVSQSATGYNRLRLGTSGGIVTTGYLTHTQYSNDVSSSAGTNNTDGAYIFGNSATVVTTGLMSLVRYGNLWVLDGQFSDTGGVGHSRTTGRIDLGAALTQIEVAATSGAFDAGALYLIGRG